MKSTFLTGICLAMALQPYSQGVYINEFSNGASGSKEFIEMVVDGGGSCTVDLRGWIFDDNNGDFGAGSGMGIASGHIRFSSTGPWGAIPSGSIIVIYNVTDPNTMLPADDPYDANSDNVYIIPSNDPALEYCTSVPVSGGSTAYTPCTYSSPANWTSIGLANGGDAAQVRDVSGNYFHGVSYGSSLSGGPDNLNFTGSGTGKFFYFNGTNYRSIANWSSGTVGSAPFETPGAPNNATNNAFIATLVCAVLPVEFLYFNTVVTQNEVNLLWATTSETNCSEFIIERAGSDFRFSALGKQNGAGNSVSTLHYSFRDNEPLDGTSYYRLKQVDFDGNVSYSSVRAVTRTSNELDATYYNGIITINGCEENTRVEIIDLNGSIIRSAETTGRFNTSGIGNGIYLCRVQCAQYMYTFRFLNQE